MMENYNQQNIVVNEGNILRFMPNQIYIVNEPLRFENADRSENFTRHNEMIDFKEVPCSEETTPSCLRNGDQYTYLQMVWNEPDSNFQTHFMALSDNILTDQNESVSQNISNSLPVYEIDDSDEEDDVVFVKAYPIQNQELQNVEKDKEPTEIMPKEEKKPRRNPSRKARNSKFGKKNDDENIYEEDFCMLDSSEEESSPDESVAKSPMINEEETQKLSVKDMKKWPVNGLHERPEFNTVTQKIEKFDYTIREIQNIVKKPKRDDSKKCKPRKKPTAKKYISKKRGTKSSVNKEVDSKVTLDSLKSMIEENCSDLSNFMKIIRSRYKTGSHMCPDVDLSPKNKENLAASCSNTEKHSGCLKNYESLISNQCRLYALVQKIPFQDAYNSLMKKLESDC